MRADIFIPRAVLTKRSAENTISNDKRTSSARRCRNRFEGFGGIIDNRVEFPGGTAAVSAEEWRRMKIGHWGFALRRRAITHDARAGRPA